MKQNITQEGDTTQRGAKRSGKTFFVRFLIALLFLILFFLLASFFSFDGRLWVADVSSTFKVEGLAVRTRGESADLNWTVNLAKLHSYNRSREKVPGQNQSSIWPGNFDPSSNMRAYNQSREDDHGQNQNQGDIKPTIPARIRHLGWDKSYGRTNNQLIAVLNAFDMAFDEEEGDGDGNGARKMIAVSGWARSVLRSFFFDASLPGWELRIENSDVPIIDYERLPSGATEIIPVESKDAYLYHLQNKKGVSVEKMRLMRNRMLGVLLPHISESIMTGVRGLPAKLSAATGNTTFGLKKEIYATVHLRWLEGNCEKWIGGDLPHHECSMAPSYVKQVLRSSGMHRQVPIVVITDFQNSAALHELQSDAEIGPLVVVVSSRRSGVAADMMVAVHSDIFVGVRVSTMAVMIGQMRVALGKDPKTNYIFDYTNKDGELKVCEECLYACTKRFLCGNGSVTPLALTAG